MILIIGGAYQGKLDFAKNQYGITEEEIYTCTVKVCYNEAARNCSNYQIPCTKGTL